MPKGRLPVEYFDNPKPAKSREEIFQDLDGFTCELFADEPQFHQWVEFFVVLPPLEYEGRFVKGLYFSQGVDLICDLHPQVSQLFNSIAYSMCCAYPWSERADVFFSMYEYPEREKRFRKLKPARKNTPLLPYQDADYTNEYVFAPAPVAKRDIDLLCVARLDAVKNLPILAEALKVHRRKYSNAPIKLTLALGKEFDLNYSGLNDSELAIMRRIEEILVHPRDYIHFVPRIDHYQLPSHFSRAKAVVLPSLLEGKNRCLAEAMCSDTPVICFEALNQFHVGKDRVFPEGAGLLSPYSPEGLADTIQEVVTNRDAFKPRRKFLERFGRKQVLNACLDSIPYYRQNLPEYKQGGALDNMWLDLAVQHNYQLGLHDFIHDRNAAISRAQGLERIREIVAFYAKRWPERAAAA